MLIGGQAGVKVYLALAPTDMRKSFDGLSALTQNVLAQDPFTGHWFVFRNKAGNRVKLLAWDGTGLSLYYKRLDSGTFYWPALESGCCDLSVAELNLLIDGMDWRRLAIRQPAQPGVSN